MSTAVLKTPPSEQRKIHFEGGGGGNFGNSSGGGGGGDGGGDNRWISANVKYASIGQFCQSTLYKMMTKEKFEEMEENSMLYISNIMEMRKFIDSNEFIFEKAWDLKH